MPLEEEEEYSIYVLGRVLGISSLKAIRSHNKIYTSEFQNVTVP